MMVKYLIRSKLPSEKINMLDSDIQKEHWRATTQQNAVDIAPLILDGILKGQLQTNRKDGAYYFMVIAEQPYAGRMARQVQRAFNAELNKRDSNLKIFVEGCGPAILSKSTDTLTRLNSELAALGAERFADARIKLKNCNTPKLRDPRILMFSSRDDFYLQQKMKLRSSSGVDSFTKNLVKVSMFVYADGTVKVGIAPEAEVNNPQPKKLSPLI